MRPMRRRCSSQGTRIACLAWRGGSPAPKKTLKKLPRTLWTVLAKINSSRGDAAFGSWVYRITANAALEKLRARKGKAGER